MLMPHLTTNTNLLTYLPTYNYLCKGSITRGISRGVIHAIFLKKMGYPGLFSFIYVFSNKHFLQQIK